VLRHPLPGEGDGGSAGDRRLTAGVVSGAAAARKDLLADADTAPDVREYIREKIRAGKFLIKSIHQRQDTITRIATEIVKRQRDFMGHGVSRLKPLTMVQVAEVVGVGLVVVPSGRVIVQVTVAVAATPASVVT
jgi:hypothetical protein